MSKGRLTRQELGWLLTQEAQGAAERLRKGVSALTQAPPPPDVEAEGTDVTGMSATLSVLDDTMKMLSSLHARPVGMKGRRGRIDLASLLWEVAPEARVSIEPGSGTEVFGDEAELRRMLHVMLGHGSGTGSTVSIRREGDEVAVGVVLGPDSSATAETERAWLSRMAIRYGGRYELEGGMEVLGLPADGIEARDDVSRLRRELDEARRQGEAYARELAAAFTGDELAPLSTLPPPERRGQPERLAAIVRLSGGVAASLRAMLSPVGRELADLRSAISPRKSSPDLETAAKLGVDDQLEGVRRKLLAVQDFVAELASMGECDAHEPAILVDMTSVVQAEIQASQSRAARYEVEVRLRVFPHGTRSGVLARVPPRLAHALARGLLSHGLSASGRRTTLGVTLHDASGSDSGVRLVFDDTGTTLPAAARRAILGLEVEPGTFGRPSSIGLFLAAEAAAGCGAFLEIADAPVEHDLGGGVRVSVTLPR